MKSRKRSDVHFSNIAVSAALERKRGQTIYLENQMYLVCSVHNLYPCLVLDNHAFGCGKSIANMVESVLVESSVQRVVSTRR